MDVHFTVRWNGRVPGAASSCSQQHPQSPGDHLNTAELVRSSRLLQRFERQQMRQLVALRYLPSQGIIEEFGQHGRGGATATRIRRRCATIARIMQKQHGTPIWISEASWHAAASAGPWKWAHLQHHARLEGAFDVDVKLSFGEPSDEGFGRAGQAAVELRHGSEDPDCTADWRSRQSSQGMRRNLD